MKKILSILLVFSLIFVNISFSAAAISGSEHKAEFVGIETEFAGIMQFGQNKYAYHADGNTTLMLGRLDIDILNDIEYQNAMNRNDIPDEVKVALKERREEAIQNGVTLKIVTIFSPDFVDESGVVPFSNSDEKYYDYQGHQMKSVYFYEKSISTGWQTVEEGTISFNVANLISTAVLSAGSNSPKRAIRFISNGITLAQAFLNIHPATVIYGSKSDFLQAKCEYDAIHQYTYGRFEGGNWNLGVITHRITVNKLGHYQYYYDSKSGKGLVESEDKSVYEVYKSDHFDNPWETAWRDMGYAENERLYIDVHGARLAILQ